MVRKIRSVGRDRLVAAARCTCGRTLDGATSVNGDFAPQPGDLTVCIYCRCILAYTKTGALEPVESATLPPEVRAVVEELRETIAKASSS